MGGSESDSEGSDSDDSTHDERDRKLMQFQEQLRIMQEQLRSLMEDSARGRKKKEKSKKELKREKDRSGGALPTNLVDGVNMIHPMAGPLLSMGASSQPPVVAMPDMMPMSGMPGIVDSKLVPSGKQLKTAKMNAAANQAKKQRSSTSKSSSVSGKKKPANCRTCSRCATLKSP